MKSIKDFKNHELTESQAKTVYGGEDGFFDVAGRVAGKVVKAGLKYFTVPGWFLID